MRILNVVQIVFTMPLIVKTRAEKGKMKTIKTTKPFKIRHSVPLIAAIEMIIETKILKKGIGRTLQAIAMHWNKEGEIFPSQEYIASLTNVDRRTVVTHTNELKTLGLIRTISRPNIIVNGQQVRRSNIYVFVDSVIGILFKKARAVLRAAKKKAAIKDHLASTKKDHTISSPKGKQVKDKNTVKINLSHVFFKKRLEAIQSETEHHDKLAAASAYKAATKRNQIARGEILSDDEIAMRKIISHRESGLRKNSAVTNGKVRALETAIMTWNATKKGFTKAMHAEMTRYTELLSPMAKIIFKKYSEL